MNKETGGPAFPNKNPRNDRRNQVIIYEEGMTLRDYFAAKAMQSLLIRSSSLTYGETAERAHTMADAILKERDK